MLGNFSDMQGSHHPAAGSGATFEKQAIALLDGASGKAKSQLKDVLYHFLTQASETEQLLSLQYLYAAFSLKKFPEEFDDYNPQAEAENETNLLRLSQIESIRRWEANVLYVARQEMEHLNLVQNLIAILGYEPYFFRPNYPVPPQNNVLGLPVSLMPFSRHSIEIFRFWEKPDRMHLPDPFRHDGVPQAVKAMAAVSTKDMALPLDYEGTREKAWQLIVDILNGKDYQVHCVSIEELYTYIAVFFYFMLQYKVITGTNLNRIVNEHFGFNVTLEPVIDGKYYSYVGQVIQQIVDEGEGVWGVPPPLDSHFMVFQTVLTDMQTYETNASAPFLPALPVVWNPTISQEPSYHNASLPALGMDGKTEESALYQVTNQVAIAAMQLFNQAYNELVHMLFGFFRDYSINDTTGIRPKHINAFFQTAYYPFMTMVIRPLGEMVCRLPADENYTPVPGKLPPLTAGPNFFFNIHQRADVSEINKHFRDRQSEVHFLQSFQEMAKQAMQLSVLCKEKNYHIANYLQTDARDFDVRFQYLSENFTRIAQNFESYWSGQIIAPIPSSDFQNFTTTYN